MTNDKQKITKYLLKRSAIYGLILLSAFVFFALIQFYIYQSDRYLHLIACDVGQGDSELIIMNEFRVLVDGGPDKKVLTCLNRYIPWWQRKLDLLVVTHFDLDHSGGISDAISTYKTKRIILPSCDLDQLVKSQPRLVEKLVTAAIRGTMIEEPVFGPLIDSPGSNLRLNIISPMASDVLIDKNVQPSCAKKIIKIAEYLITNRDDKKANFLDHYYFLKPDIEAILSAINDLEFGEITDNKVDENDGSIVLKVSYKAFDALLTGDISKNREMAMLDREVITPSEVLKIAHHGSKSSSSPEFIDKVKPELAIISVGQRNKYHHPDKNVLARFEQSGATIKRTDQDGTVEITSDGQKYWTQVYQGP